MKFAKLAVMAATLATVPMAANAQDAGTVIYGNDGEPVGTVTRKTDKAIVVDTGTYKAPLPAVAAVLQEDKWVIGSTKAEVNSMVAERKAKAEAKLTAALVPGTAVISGEDLVRSGTPRALMDV